MLIRIDRMRVRIQDNKITKLISNQSFKSREKKQFKSIPETLQVLWQKLPVYWRRRYYFEDPWAQHERQRWANSVTIHCRPRSRVQHQEPGRGAQAGGGVPHICWGTGPAHGLAAQDCPREADVFKAGRLHATRVGPGCETAVEEGSKCCPARPRDQVHHPGHVSGGRNHPRPCRLIGLNS